ncbi:MAG TPA: hypothetical protein VKB88_38265, partial [Bryobacteraceae bacterium]|nr:hypothetical protein [Bryobacteraceae bacterium]
AMGANLYQMGQFIPGQTHLELAYSLYDPARYPSHAISFDGFDIAVHSLGYSCLALWHLGFPEQALDRAEQAMILARDLANPFTLCGAQWFLAGIHWMRGETTKALKLADAAFHLAKEHGFQLSSAFAIGLRASALIADGQAAEGITCLGECLDAARAGGLRVMAPIYLADLAAGYGRLGQVDEGFAAIAEAMALVESTGCRFWEAELHRLKGELTLKRNKFLAD